MKVAAALAINCLLGMTGATAAVAFDVSPAVTVIELPSGTSGSSISVFNPRNEELPVTMSIVERTIHEDGSEVTRPANELFGIFPPQAVIPPGASQTVRLTWVGPQLQQSRSFSFFVQEVPVALRPEDGSQIQRILKVGSSVHVTPSSARATPTLVGSRPINGGIEVTLGNEGNSYYYIDWIGLDFGGVQFTGLALGNIAGRTLVPPGARRTFFVPGVSGTPSLSAR